MTMSEAELEFHKAAAMERVLGELVLRLIPHIDDDSAAVEICRAVAEVYDRETAAVNG